MTADEQAELQVILRRGHWIGTRFIPQPADAALFHLLSEKHSEELRHAGERSSRC